MFYRSFVQEIQDVGPSFVGVPVGRALSVITEKRGGQC